MNTGREQRGKRLSALGRAVIKGKANRKMKEMLRVN